MGGSKCHKELPTISYHFLQGVSSITPPELSIYPEKETSWPIVQFDFISTPTSPELAGGIAAPFLGPTTNLSPTSY